MSWIPLGDGIYALEPENDPVMTVSIIELQDEIDELNGKVKTVPDAETLDFYLEHHPDQQNFKIQLEKKESLLKEILGE